MTIPLYHLREQKHYIYPAHLQFRIGSGAVGCRRSHALVAAGLLITGWAAKDFTTLSSTVCADLNFFPNPPSKYHLRGLGPTPLHLLAYRYTDTSITSPLFEYHLRGLRLHPNPDTRVPV